MSKKEDAKATTSDSKNSHHTLLEASLELRAFIATCFVIFLMFLAGISGYTWGHTHALEAQALENLSDTAPKKTLFQKDVDAFPVYERTGTVLEVNKDFFLIRFPESNNKVVQAYTSPNTTYLLYPFISAGPEPLAPTEARKISRDEIIQGSQIQVHAETDMRSADSFFATKMIQLP